MHRSTRAKVVKKERAISASDVVSDSYDIRDVAVERSKEVHGRWCELHKKSM